MKRTIQLIIIVAALAMFGACTHNNGDIGSWFGTWHVEEIVDDGTVSADYQGDIFFQFQSTVFCVRRNDNRHTDYLESYGRWSEADATLTITFPDPSVAYQDFSEVLDAENVFTIADRTGRRMVLTRTDAAGHTHRLTLKKIP